MKILYVTRNFPPTTGGMENAAYELYEALRKEHEVTLVKWGGGKKLLPVVYPLLGIQALWHGLRNKPDVIYLQDGLMALIGTGLKRVLRRPTLITVHGLEATYSNPRTNFIYKPLVTKMIPKQTAVVTGSTATQQVVAAALPGVQPKLISYGVNDVFYEPGKREAQLKLIAKETGVPLAKLQSHKILHTGGRLIRRKGVLWFVNNVMPQLVADGQKVIYLVSGSGKQKEAIEAAITKHGLQDSVFLLGRVSNQVLKALYNTADIFVMPNIPVAGDMEGFGLVSLEAASCGTLVVASRLEGIADAIQHGQNGILVEPQDVKSYVKTIESELHKRSLSPASVRAHTLQHNSWQSSAEHYAVLMQELSAAYRR